MGWSGRRREAPRGARPPRLPAGELPPALSRSSGTEPAALPPGVWPLAPGMAARPPRAPRSGGPRGGSWNSGSGRRPRCSGVRRGPGSHPAGTRCRSPLLREDAGDRRGISQPFPRSACGVGMRSEESIELSPLVDFFFSFYFLFLFPPRLASVMPFHVKFNIFRVSHGCVMCRAISPEGAAAGSPERGHRQQPRVPKTREAHPLPSLLQTPHECPRSTSPGSSRLRTREGMAKEGSALGN